MTWTDPGTYPGTCSGRSLAAGEPLCGTASRYRLWLMVEQPGRWGHDALVDSRFPREVGAVVRALGEELGVRVLLIKRRDRPAPRRRRCYAAYTGIRDRRLFWFEVQDPAELLELDLPTLAGARFAGLGEPWPDPVYLVCTHGKHDPCCARHGTPLAAALEGFGDAAVWESTHVGGDRFAGNLVCFPHGLFFGRVAPADALRVARAYAAGRIDLALYRGRSCYSPPVQAAECLVREEGGLDAVDELVLAAHERLGDGRHRVRFRGTGGGIRTVELYAASAPERLLTCKATHPHHPRAFVRPALS